MKRVQVAIIFFVLQSFLLMNAAQLVDVTKVIPNIKTDIVYATNRNFTGKVIYKVPKCYLLQQVAEHLAKVQKELNEIGLGLLVWDAYRPLPAQWKLWNVCPNPRYVGDPRKGGFHTRGVAVDLTIICLSDGSSLEMPTGFDDFTPKASAHYADISDEAKKNRLFLRLIMEKHGFVNFASEWWHFNYRGWQNYPVLEIDFDELS